MTRSYNLDNTTKEITKIQNGIFDSNDNEIANNIYRTTLINFAIDKLMKMETTYPNKVVLYLFD